MRIAISGASGFIAGYLSEYFLGKGHIILPLNRKLFTDESNDELIDILSGSDVVINLAGAPINRRWTKAYKKELFDSRITTTRKLISAINRASPKPKLLISGSAVGYYSSASCYDEYTFTKGESFLSDLCEKWEQEAEQVSSEVRLVISRLGVVLSPKGGAFDKMMLPAKFRIATIIGSGDQAFSWIAINDLIRAMEYIIDTPTIAGTVNFVAPHQISNKELMVTAAKHYRSLITIKIPSFIFHILLGEAAQFMTQGQCVYPKKLLDSGFKFKNKTISDFFQNLPK